MILGYINLISQMIISNGVSTETDEVTERTNKQYNLRTRPKSKVKFTLTQSDNQTIVLLKTHAHIMLTQLNIKDGLKAYGNKGYPAILK